VARDSFPGAEASDPTLPVTVGLSAFRRLPDRFVLARDFAVCGWASLQPLRLW